MNATPSERAPTAWVRLVHWVHLVHLVRLGPLGVCGLVAVAACASPGQPAGPVAPPPAGGPPAAAAPRGAAGEAQLQRVQALIGSARCTADAQCRVIGIGDRPCGGPESYLAWSTTQTDAQALEAAARAHADERRRWHEKAGLMSTCEFRPPPAARCDRRAEGDGRCVTVPQREAQR